MPLKGRSQPCDDPFKRGILKHQRYKDVTTLSTSTLEEYRHKLPKYKWKDGTRLCFQCRVKASAIANSRSEGLKLAQHLEDGNSEHVLKYLGNNLTSNIGTSILHRSNEGTEDMQALSVYSQPSAPMLSQLSNEAEPDQTSGIESGPSPSSSGNGTDFVTPVRPSTSTGLPVGLSSTAVQLQFNDPDPIEPTSPSLADTNISNASGSVFHDEGAAKIKLHNFLNQLGVELPDKHAKQRPGRLVSKMSEAMQAFKNMFQEYAGRPLPEEACACPFCKLITAAVKAKLSETKSKEEQYLLLTSLPPFVTIKQMHDEFGVTWYMARTASKLRATEGPFTSPKWKSTGHPISDEIQEKVKKFYLSEDNSKPDPTADTSINILNEHGVRKRVERRIMLANLKESYQEFKRIASGVKLGISKFAELRPKNVKWPGQAGYHYSCLCIMHENFKLMLEGLYAASLAGIEEELSTDPSVATFMERFRDYKKFIAYVICDPPTEDCYMGYCEMCPLSENIDQILSFSEGNEIRYKYWEKNELVTRIDDYSFFAENFQPILLKFLVHDFIYRQQKEYIKFIKTGSLDNGTTGVLTVDFGENYSFVVQNAVAGFHWSNNMATIHPFVFYTSGSTPGEPEYKTFFVISDDLKHDATAFHCFRVNVIQKIKEQFPQIRSIDYISDGAISQYKNSSNIANLLYHQDDFGLSARWTYSCTAHGKNTCDAMSSVVKGTVRRRSLKLDRSMEPITTPRRMFDVAVDEISSPKLEFLYITRDDVEYYREALKPRYENMKKLKGTRQWHYLAVGENKTLITKRFGFSTTSQMYDVIITPTEDMDDMEVEDHNAQIILPVIGEFYALFVGKKYQIGRVCEYSEKEETVRFQMMQKRGRAGIALSWPASENFQDFETSNIITKVSAPYYHEEAKTYRLLEKDLDSIRDFLWKNLCDIPENVTT